MAVLTCRISPDGAYEMYGPYLFMMTVSHANLVTRYTLSSYLEISRISVGFDSFLLNILLLTGSYASQTAIYVVFSTAVAADFCIAATMCYYLHRGRSMARSRCAASKPSRV